MKYLFLSFIIFRLLAQRKAQSSVALSDADADSDEIITDLSYSKER